MKGVLKPRWLGAALLGLAAIVVSLLIEPTTLLTTYLATVVTLSAIPVGAIAVLMVTYLVRGAWTEGLHIPLTAAALTTPIAAALFIPVLIALPWLYPWTQGAGVEAGSLKAMWLAPGFFVIRTVLYFALWTVLAIWIRRAWAEPRRMVATASAGLILYALSASFAGVDWLESLTPEFHSSIYGLLFLTFQLLAGLAFALTIVLSKPGAPTFRYGATLLSLLLLWAYNHAMQYIIIWSGNIPDEAAWYLAREAGAWGVVLWTLFALQFIIPFFAMLSSTIRNGRRSLLFIASLTVALRFLEAFILALPQRQIDDIALFLAIPGTIVFAGLVWWVAFEFSLERVRRSARDTRPLPDAFDASGTPVASAGKS
jgi:hypothetical protein